jgi:hypothetical protein
VPIELWLLLNQHLDLANETECAVLQAIVAEKIRDALKQVTLQIINYIRTHDKVELELLCAITNDSALQVEEVCRLIESIGNEEVRIAIDEAYEHLIFDLVWCGETCLSRLIAMIISDVNDHLNQVFTEKWLHGSSINVVIATICDYSNDFEKYLLPFWLDRFFVQLLETIVLRYAYALIFQHSFVDQNHSTLNYGQSVLHYKLQKTDRVSVESETLARIAKDMSQLTQFVSSRLTTSKANSIMLIINEILEYLQSSLDEIIFQASARMDSYPEASQVLFSLLN